MVEGNLRYDGSSRFRRGNRWILTPSFSLGWNIAREAFFESLAEKISTLKLRVSYGTLANANIYNWYPTYQTMDVKASNGTPLVYPKETGIVVFVQYYMDEQGKEQMVRGMSLAEQGMRAFQAYCEPVSIAPAATTAPMQTDTIAPQAQPAPAAAQAAAGTIVQIGTNPDGSPIYGTAPAVPA